MQAERCAEAAGTMRTAKNDVQAEERNATTVNSVSQSLPSSLYIAYYFSIIMPQCMLSIGQSIHSIGPTSQTGPSKTEIRR